MEPAPAPAPTPAPAAADPAPKASPSLKIWFWPWLIGFLVVDLWTKAAIFDTGEEPLPELGMRMRQLLEHWHGTPLIRPSYNRGVAWSMFNEHPEMVVLMTVALIPVLIVVFWRWFRHSSRWEILAFGAVLGGAFGNAWDRLWSLDPATSAIWGVRDFIHVDLGFWPLAPWPTFNVADTGITVGFLLLVLASFRAPGNAASGTTDPSAKPGI